MSADLTVLIKTRTGDMRVQAWRTKSLLFAIHETSMALEGGAAQAVTLWTITHVPTGMALLPNAPSRWVAERILDKVLELGLDWEAFTENGAALRFPQPEFVRDAYAACDLVMEEAEGILEELGIWPEPDGADLASDPVIQ